MLVQFMLPSNQVCGCDCGFSNKFLNFKAIIVLFSSISYDKMFYTFADTQISTMMTSGCSVELQKT